MRIVLFILGGIVLVAVAAAVYFRLAPMTAEEWHVDPATAIAPSSPNFALRQGVDAPLVPGTPGQIAAQLDAVAASDGAVRIAGDTDSFVTYVSRSRLMGFPDAISIRLTAEGDATRVEIFSRARFGHSDMGVNEARVARWIDAATP